MNGLITEEETREKIVDVLVRQLRESTEDLSLEELERISIENPALSLEHSFRLEEMQEAVGEYFEQF